MGDVVETVLLLRHPLVVIRHGETAWNAVGRLQGRDDIPLNDRGRKQARRNGAALKAHLARVGLSPAQFRYVASPLSRASETMRLVRGELGLEPGDFAHDDRLMELAYGRWSGLLFSEVARTDPAGYAARDADRWSARPPGGESTADGAARVRPFIEEIAGPTVIVTHGGLNRAIKVLIGALDRAAAARFTTPQDRFYMVQGGRVEWV
jgi:broad specificity phosphatase PhoE